MLTGLRAVVDVQHLYRPKKPRDQGSVYTLLGGTRTTEASAVLIYAAALTTYLTEHGGQVLTNDWTHGILVGPYSARHVAVNAWGAHVYLACHLNAGGGSYALVEYMTGSEGKLLASAIGQSLTETFPEIREHRTQALASTDRGAVCIERVATPTVAVLSEPFFGDNPAQQGLLAAAELKRVGEAIGSAVSGWWRSRPAPA